MDHQSEAPKRGHWHSGVTVESSEGYRWAYSDIPLPKAVGEMALQEEAKLTPQVSNEDFPPAFDLPPEEY